MSVVVSESDIPGSSLNERNPSELKNDAFRFWLKCRDDPAKGLRSKAQLVLFDRCDVKIKQTGQTRLLRCVPFVHLPFIFRSFGLFVASILFRKGISYCVIRRKLEP